MNPVYQVVAPRQGVFCHTARQWLQNCTKRNYPRAQMLMSLQRWLRCSMRTTSYGVNGLLKATSAFSRPNST
ncbi:hypothetical protein D8M19_05805 [Corynebacterium pseudodiphtheriticum]|nr:hypothetical protein D8M19_05805 [Corynebacterium pseudodiphtheriticum]